MTSEQRTVKEVMTSCENDGDAFVAHKEMEEEEEKQSLCNVKIRAREAETQQKA